MAAASFKGKREDIPVAETSKEPLSKEERLPIQVRPGGKKKRRRRSRTVDVPEVLKRKKRVRSFIRKKSPDGALRGRGGKKS